MIYRLLFLLLVSVSGVAAQQPTASPTPNQSPSPTPAPTAQAQAKATYETLLARVKQSDPTVDFKELRLAYTETAEYSPYSGDVAGRTRMLAALRANEYDKVLEFAGATLSRNYLDIMGHFGCFVAQRELGHAELAAYHRAVFDGLLASIKNSGDGKTEETAFVVISTDEEYALFNYLGLRPQGQALITKDGHSFDRMTALNPASNETLTYYFNIDKPYHWLGKSLKN